MIGLQMGGFCLSVELAQGGSVTNGATPSIFYAELNHQIFKWYGSLQYGMPMGPNKSLFRMHFWFKGLTLYISQMSAMLLLSDLNLIVLLIFLDKSA